MSSGVPKKGRRYRAKSSSRLFVPVRSSAPSFRSAVAAALLFLSTVSACGQGAVCSFRGTINAPENRSMRRSLLKKGMGEICPQILARNAPLKMSSESPVIGRFYPQLCTSKDLDDSGNLYVELQGFGYGFTNVTKKLSFTMSGAIEYGQDFLIAKDVCDIYAYFRPKRVVQSDFKVNKIEQPAASFLSNLSPVADNFGKQLVAGKLQEGFTVIHDHENNDDFDVGLIELGTKPKHPFDMTGSERYTYENLRTEVHANQRDFIGPIKIDKKGRALFFKMTLDGAPALDLAVLKKEEGEASLRAYVDYAQVGPLLGVPVFADVVRSGAEYTKTVPLPEGVYWVVLDNTPLAGMVAPPGLPYDDRAGAVSYAVQIGDAP